MAERQTSVTFSEISFIKRLCHNFQFDLLSDKIFLYLNVVFVMFYYTLTYKMNDFVSRRTTLPFAFLLSFLMGVNS